MASVKYSLFAFAVLLLSMSVFSQRNPTEEYCSLLGYDYIVQKGIDGEQGICRISTTEFCDAWEFLTGKCADKYSYCSRKGYKQEIADGAVCGSKNANTKCLVCILENGTRKTALDLLKNEPTYCGDGKCALGEDFRTCPIDCPFNKSERYCQTSYDGICLPECDYVDPDCLSAKKSGKLLVSNNSHESIGTGNDTEDKQTNGDTDSTNKTIAQYCFFILTILLIMAVIILTYRRIKEKKIEKEHEQLLKWTEEQERLKNTVKPTA